MKKRILFALVIVVALAFGLTVGILAAGAGGTKDDPLVTLSYLNEKFKADIVKELDAKITKQGEELAKKVDEKLGGLNTEGTAVPADAFLLVTLTRGQILKCSEGAELLPREGSVTVSGAALADTTTGATAAVGSAAEINHMYLVTAANGGVTAASDAVKLLVRGTYTIG